MGISIYIIISGAIGVLIGGLLAGLFIKITVRKLKKRLGKEPKVLSEKLRLQQKGLKR